MSTNLQSDTVEHEVRTFIVDNFLFGQQTSLSDDASLVEQGIIDSTGILELVRFLEERFGFEIEDEELVPENLDCIRRLGQFVRKKTGAGQ